jgi:hypothetical protein
MPTSRDRGQFLIVKRFGEDGFAPQYAAFATSEILKALRNRRSFSFPGKPEKPVLFFRRVHTR